MKDKNLKKKLINIIDSDLNYGLFNLDEFIGYPIEVVNKYFKDKGWESVDCFNDYKWAWTNKKLKKSIVAKVDFVDFSEIVNLIYCINGIYSEGSGIN